LPVSENISMSALDGGRGLLARSILLVGKSPGGKTECTFEEPGYQMLRSKNWTMYPQVVVFFLPVASFSASAREEPLLCRLKAASWNYARILLFWRKSYEHDPKP
jgi:hypothetical protein